MLSAADIARFRADMDAFRASDGAALLLSTAHGATPYGTTWTRWTTSGDGITAPKTITNAGAISGAAVVQLPSSLAVALASSETPQAVWRFVTTDQVAIGDAIQNAADTSVVFTVETADPIGSITIGRLSPGGATG